MGFGKFSDLKTSVHGMHSGGRKPKRTFRAEREWVGNIFDGMPGGKSAPQ